MMLSVQENIQFVEHQAQQRRTNQQDDRSQHGQCSTLVFRHIQQFFAALPHQIDDIKLQQHRYDAQVGQDARQNLQQECHRHAIARKLLRQQHIIGLLKHPDSYLIDQIGRQEVGAKLRHHHGGTLHHGILVVLGTAPPPFEDRTQEYREGREAYHRIDIYERHLTDIGAQADFLPRLGRIRNQQKGNMY